MEREQKLNLEISLNFDILSNDNLEYKIENFVDIEMHSLED